MQIGTSGTGWVYCYKNQPTLALTLKNILVPCSLCACAHTHPHPHPHKCPFLKSGKKHKCLFLNRFVNTLCKFKIYFKFFFFTSTFISLAIFSFILTRLHNFNPRSNQPSTYSALVYRLQSTVIPWRITVKYI